MPLSNSTAQILAVTPYFDDYYTQNTSGQFDGVEFDFHRILFRPRYGVQARELTQMQTLLQTQLERLGTSQFRNGDRVIGGQLTINLRANSGQVLSSTSLSSLFNRTTNVGKNMFLVSPSGSETTRTTVLQYSAIDDGETSNNYLIFGEVLSGGFSPGNIIQDRDSEVTATFAATGAVFNPASLVSIDEGVCFVSGLFVRIRPQTIVLNALSNTPSYRIGLNIIEEILDEQDDVVGESLGDPANQKAPGAHRLRVRLQLAKRGIEESSYDNFITLGVVNNGVLQTTPQKTGFVTVRELEDILARRTYDESGDYLIRQFSPVIEGSSTANTTNAQDEKTFTLSLSAGKAYVRGYEVATNDVTRLPINKARSSANIENGSLSATVGNYTYVTRLSSASPTSFFANIGTVDLHCVPAASIQAGTSTAYNYSRIGTARVRMVEAGHLPEDITPYSSVTSYINDSSYKLFFFDTKFDELSGSIVTATYDTTTTKTTLIIDAPGTAGQAGANGVPRVNGALEGVSIAIDGVSSGIYTIESYTTEESGATGNVHVVLKEFVSALPANNTGYRLLFQPRDIDSFTTYSASADVNAPFTDRLAFQADVSPKAKDDGTPTGYTKISGQNDNSLIYQIPQSFIVPDSLGPDSVEYTAWVQSDTAITTTGVANVSVTLNFDQADYLSMPTGTPSAKTAADTFVVFDITNDTNGRGYVVNFSDSANGTSRCIDGVVVSDTSVTFTYRHGASIGSARSFIAVGRGVLAGHPPRTKLWFSGNTTAVRSGSSTALLDGQIEYHSLNTAAGFAYSFKTADVTRIAKVLYKTANVAFANTDLSTATDVTSYFTLDTGQRDNTYEYSRAIINRGASSVIAPTGRLLFIFDWFKHEGQGYVFLDSYLNTSNKENGFTYEDVPSFTSPKTDRTISLRNVIDFRAVQSNYEFLTGALQFAASSTTANTGYLTAEVSPKPYLMPASDRDWQGSYAYYLSRTDRIAVTGNGQFIVVEGDPAVTPQPPTIDAASMLIYELQVPAYTLVDDDGKPTTVRIKSFDHKRYTMQDLVKVEDRIAHLEYYTALSQLEKAARDQSILDENNQERFKNGIVVDSFAGTDVGDVTRTDWAASIDTASQTLRPTFEYAGHDDHKYSFDFSVSLGDTNSSGVRVVGDMAIPTWTEQAYITQSLATHSVSVNPFNISNYYGVMELSPAVDTGKSIRPAQVIDMGGPSQAWVDANIPSYTNWGEWQTTWSGTPNITTRQEWWVPEGWDEDNHPWRSKKVTTFEDIETHVRQQRLGTQYSYQSVPTTVSLGNIIVDTSVVHSIRKRDLVFSATGLKPNTSMYAYFDGTVVQAYVQRANVLRLDSIPMTTRFWSSPADSTRPLALQKGNTIYVRKPLTGTVSVAAATRTITGTNTKFQYELIAGQYVQITKGADTYTQFIANVTSNTAASLVSASPVGVSVTGATLSTLTPVTIADVAERVYTKDDVEYIQYTLKVVRVQRDAAIDYIVPYTIQAGSLSPTKLVNDTNNTTTFSEVILNGGGIINVNAADIYSGIVRGYNSAAHTIRLDNDAPATSNNDIPVGTVVYFVGGAGAGQQAVVTAYDAGTQTVTLDSTVTLSNITIGTTIYSIGALRSDGFLPQSISVSGGYDESALTGASVITYAGSVSGALHLQEGQFPVGNRMFLLMDNSSNRIADTSTRAEAAYGVSGLRTVEQPTSVTTRNVVVTARGVTDEQSTLQRSSTVVDVDWVDPVAQSFLVDAKLYPLGVFITSVDLAFEDKPPVEDEAPVTVEIRPMINGYPSSTEVVPCVASSGKAIVSKLPNDVRTNNEPDLTDPTTYTRFVFPAPVHLQSGQEYALVIRSNSDRYRVYTAQVGQVVIGTTNNIVGAQPYAGSFFKSQNGSTWTAEQMEDLMFRLNRATWEVGQEAILVMRTTPFSSNVAFDSIAFYPYDVSFGNATSTTYALDILPMNPETGDLTGQLARRYSVFAGQTYTLPTRSMSRGYTGYYPAIGGFLDQNPAWYSDARFQAESSANTIDAIVTMRTYSTDVAPFVDIEKASGLGVRHHINDMPLIAGQFEIVNPPANYGNTAAYTGTISTTSGNSIVTGSGTAFSTTLIVGRDVVIGGNLVFTVSTVDSDTQFTVTQAANETRSANVYATYANQILVITGSSITAATGYGVVSGAGRYSDSNTVGVLTSIVLTSNGSGYTTSPSLNVATGVGYSNTAVVYRGEDWTIGGNGLARYMIKPVTLADGFEARDIKVYFDAYRPKGTKFYVYYRILPGTADTATLNQQSWRLMTQDTNDGIISKNPNEYREFEFSTPDSVAANSDTDTTNQFKIFAVKIVMASDNTTVIPSIRNLRAIALDE